MATLIWMLPVPSTALLTSPQFRKMLGRRCEIDLALEADDGGSSVMTMAFEGVEAFQCTHTTSMTAEMVETSYDKVVDIGLSSWLATVRLSYRGEPYTGRRASDLRHLRVCFDDGPCYEFICLSFSIES